MVVGIHLDKFIEVSRHIANNLPAVLELMPCSFELEYKCPVYQKFAFCIQYLMRFKDYVRSRVSDWLLNIDLYKIDVLTSSEEVNLELSRSDPVYGTFIVIHVDPDVATAVRRVLQVIEYTCMEYRYETIVDTIETIIQLIRYDEVRVPSLQWFLRAIDRIIDLASRVLRAMLPRRVLEREIEKLELEQVKKMIEEEVKREFMEALGKKS